ncbi:hypothetical protein Ancab_034601 [Ancistrocladus abbreviatus]
MDKELVTLFEAAKKAADAAVGDGGLAEECRCLDALKELKNFPVNYDMLVSTQGVATDGFIIGGTNKWCFLWSRRQGSRTQIGRRLRHLTKHPRKKIQTFAVDLVEIWKNVITEQANNKKNGNLGNKTLDKVEPASADSTRKVNAVKVEKTSRAETNKVEKIERYNSPRPEKIRRTETFTVERKVDNGISMKTHGMILAKKVEHERVMKQEKQAYDVKKPSPAANAPPKLTSMLKCNDASRDKVRDLLFQALSKVSAEAVQSIREEVDACDPIRVAVSAECVMFEKWGSFAGSEKQKYRSIMFNLKDSNNPDFRRKLLLGQIKPERIVHLTAEEMASDQRQAENRLIKEKALFDCERGGPPKATTDQFKCGRCGAAQVHLLPDANQKC